MPRRKLAKVGDIISWSARGGHRRGVVTKKTSDYLYVRLDEPRQLEPYEIELKLDRDPMEDTVYYHSDYTIEVFV